jgi:hypothetical protein
LAKACITGKDFEIQMQGGDLRNRIVLAAHDSYLGGHVGIQNSYKWLKSPFY